MFSLKKIDKRFLIGLCALMVAIACVGAGVTLAAWTAKTSATNIVTLGKVDVELIDIYPEEGVDDVDPGDEVEKIVSAKNIGTEPCYVRIYVKKEWRAPNGTATNSIPTSYIMPQYNTTDWVKGESNNSDFECYYYQSILAPNQSANSLFESFVLDNAFDDSTYPLYKGNIIVKAEAVQSANISDDLKRNSSDKIIGWPNGLVFS